MIVKSLAARQKIKWKKKIPTNASKRVFTAREGWTEKMIDKFAMNNNLSPPDRPCAWLLSLATSTLDGRGEKRNRGKQ